MSVSRSLVYSMLTSLVGFLTLLISSMIVSRILTPAELGLFTVSMGVISILLTLRVFGVSAFLVQARDLDDDKIRTVLGLSIAVCWPIGVLVVLLRGLTADFYGHDGINLIFLVLAGEFFIFPFRIVPLALLQRRMAFGKTFLIEGFTGVLGAGLIVTLVMMDVGVLSLAIGRLAAAAIAMSLTLGLAPHDCYFRPRFAITREIASFGGIMTLTNFFYALRAAVTPLFLGRAMGPAQAAQFEKGESPSQIIWSIVMPGVSRVLLPHFASGARDGGQDTDRFLVAVNLAMPVFWPAFATIALLAPSLIQLLYGGQWIPAGPVGSALAVAALVVCPFSFCGPLFVAAGKPGYNLATHATDMVGRVIALVVAVPYGLTWVGIALIVPAAMSSLVTIYFLRRQLRGRLSEFFAALIRPAMVTVTTALGPLAVVLWLGYRADNIILASATGAAAAGIMWVLGVLLFQRQLVTALSEAYSSARATPVDPASETP